MWQALKFVSYQSASLTQREKELHGGEQRLAAEAAQQRLSIGRLESSRQDLLRTHGASTAPEQVGTKGTIDGR